MDVYREHILDHFHNPRGWGLKMGADIQHAATNPLCGDEIIIQLFFEGATVRHMRHESKGCAISIAAASLLHEHVVGQTRDTISTLSLNSIEELLGITLPPARIKCGLLALETIQAAVQNY